MTLYRIACNFFQSEAAVLAPGAGHGSTGDGAVTISNESFMMVPRKSISFAVRFSEADDETHTGTQCENCGLKNCPMRMIPD